MRALPSVRPDAGAVRLLDGRGIIPQYWATTIPQHLEADMADLSREDIQALGRAVGLDIQEPELTEVMYSLNALLESLDAINPPGLDEVEPLPIILPPA